MIWQLRKVVIAASLAAALPAAAQNAGCQQRAGAVCGNGNLARVAATGEDASLSHGGDFTPVKASEKLSPGDRLLLGAKTAQLVLGDACSKTVSAGSLTTITRQGNLICASEFAKTGTGSRELGDGSNQGGLIPGVDDRVTLAGVAVIGAAGAGIAIAATASSQ